MIPMGGYWANESVGASRRRARKCTPLLPIRFATDLRQILIPRAPRLDGSRCNAKSGGGAPFPSAAERVVSLDISALGLLAIRVEAFSSSRAWDSRGRVVQPSASFGLWAAPKYGKFRGSPT